MKKIKEMQKIGYLNDKIYEDKHIKIDYNKDTVTFYSCQAYDKYFQDIELGSYCPDIEESDRKDFKFLLDYGDSIVYVDEITFRFYNDGVVLKIKIHNIPVELDIENEVDSEGYNIFGKYFSDEWEVWEKNLLEDMKNEKNH